MNPLRMFRVIRNLARREAGIDPAHGVSLCSDLHRLVPDFDPRVVFDVGANRGQTARELTAGFPRARIFCFEPVARTFMQLRKNTQILPNVECHNLAFGTARRTATMNAARKSELSRIVTSAEQDATPEAGSTFEQVRMDTIEEFCAEKGLQSVDLLKIDTEGHDMEVLSGAKSLLDSGQVGVIQVEAGMNSNNKTHVPLNEFRNFLESRSYFIFGFYDQTHEFPAMKPNLRRANAVFISQRLIDSTTTA